MSEVVALESEPTKQASITSWKNRVGHLLQSGNTRLVEFDHLLDRVSKEDWSFTRMRRWIDGLRDRAVTARTSTVKRLDEMPAKAVSAVAAAGRSRVKDLARSLKWLERKLGQNGSART